MEVKNIDRRKALILLSMVAVAAIMSSIVLNSYQTNATDNGEETSNGFAALSNERMMMTRPYGWFNGQSRRRWCHRFIEVSEEFEENVLNITESDQDVQNLLADGYNVTGVKPIIKTIVEADGSVEEKATEAIVMLEKDKTGHAVVWIDVEEAKVTRIVILTRTVIEKS